MFSRNKNLLLILIIIIAAFFRLFNLDTTPPGLFPDEAMNGNNALEALGTNNFKVFYPENNGREGLFINIQALFLKFIIPAFSHTEPWMLRLPSAFFGILTVLGIYFFARLLFEKDRGRSIALFASFFMAISFWHINFSRIGFRAIMAPFFLTWGLYCLILSFKKQNGLLFAILGGIIYGLGFYSYIAYRATPFLILLIFIIYRLSKIHPPNVKKNILARGLLFSITTFIIIAPLVFYFLENPSDFLGRTAQISIFSSANPLKDLSLNILKTGAMFNFMGDFNWRHNFSGRPLLFWPIGILFITGLLIAAKKLFKNFDGQFGILLGWLAITALPVVISNESMPHALRAILMMPPIFTLAGYGGITIYNKILETEISSKRTKSFVLILSVILIIESYQTYFIKWASRPEVSDAFETNYVEIGKILRDLPETIPKYVVVEAQGVNVRGMPMPTQTVMFMTDTFLPKEQDKKNIHYVLSEQQFNIPPNSLSIVLK